MREEDIDTSDIPEVKEIPPDTIPGLFYRGPMILLNEELRIYFADLAGRRGVRMNDLVIETLQKTLAVAEVAK